MLTASLTGDRRHSAGRASIEKGSGGSRGASEDLQEGRSPAAEVLWRLTEEKLLRSLYKLCYLS